MATYLLTWNPGKWQWPTAEFERVLQSLEASGRAEDQWSCGKTKRITPGDRVFLLRQGAEPRGLVASEWVTSNPFPDKHWGASGAFAPQALYVELTWDWLSATPVIDRRELDSAPFAGVNWNTQSSGISIDSEIAQALELQWGQRTGSLFQTPPDEITEPQYWEGAATVVRVNAYERNAAARAKCIEHYGPRCAVCEIDFATRYGKVGRGFIHVHHLVPVGKIKRQYKIDPVADLRPVCPNCHAVIHRQEPPYTIAEVRKMMMHAGASRSEK